MRELTLHDVCILLATHALVSAGIYRDEEIAKRAVSIAAAVMRELDDDE
jgi:hypothetical protein